MSIHGDVYAFNMGFSGFLAQLKTQESDSKLEMVIILFRRNLIVSLLLSDQLFFLTICT